MSTKYRDLTERLMANSMPVAHGHTIDGEPSDCWDWIGNLHEKGYGRITLRIGGKHRKVLAHRAAFVELTGRALTPEETLDHECRNTRCIRPCHVKVMPVGDNSARMHQFWRNYRAQRAGQQELQA